ncbi:hypothetical protein [Parabacteroides distasonis]|jgi:hypothetical protein|uniref:hypothetical protein n=1 Tax=Parabacteroides distasonis TaxID=823 RepID=UPI001CC9D5A7|nr:hypothetical protein [Parabacteroides distasonis]UBD81488.1 hypothetical protein K6V20_08655 [Parabacteroides distasonis]
MNKREAKILALEVFAENVDLLIESESVSDAIKSSKDCDLINEVFDELAGSFKKRADKLKLNNKK